MAHSKETPKIYFHVYRAKSSPHNQNWYAHRSIVSYGNVPSGRFSWYCEKSGWKARSFFTINMIWIMRPLIWIFTKQHFYLIHGPYDHQKYGIAFSWPIRCHIMSCETIKASCRILFCGPTTWWIDPNCKVLSLNGRIFSNASKLILKYCNLACIICKKYVFS